MLTFPELTSILRRDQAEIEEQRRVELRREVERIILKYDRDWTAYPELFYARIMGGERLYEARLRVIARQLLEING
jgi:hypothetical protein